jgi:hypothetical protein
MQRTDIFPTLIAFLILGGGLYLSTFPTGIISSIGIAIMAIAFVSMALWLDLRPPNKPKLRVTRFYPRNDVYMCFWYVDIQNIGRTAATRLRFQLDGIENGPNDPSWKGLYPYDVRPEKIKHLPDWSAVPLAIDRDETIPFELFETRLSSDQHFRVVGLDARKIDRLNDAAVVLNPGEKWLLTYKVGANDVDLLTVHVRIDFKDGKPFAEMVE